MFAGQPRITGKWNYEDKETVARLARMDFSPKEIGSKVGRTVGSIYALRERLPELWAKEVKPRPIDPPEYQHYRSRSGISLARVSILHLEAR